MPVAGSRITKPSEPGRPIDPFGILGKSQIVVVAAAAAVVVVAVAVAAAEVLVGASEHVEVVWDRRVGFVV